MKTAGSGAELIYWFAPFGLASRSFVRCFSITGLRDLHWQEFRAYCHWLGQESLHFVVLSAVFVSIALTIQCVIELKKYGAEDLAGAVISLGLLRELGPMTVSTAWCARVSAFISEEVLLYKEQYLSAEVPSSFILTRYLAAVAMSIPLSGYGLVAGFVTAALIAPLLGCSSVSDFLEPARLSIDNKDLVVYFAKLIFVNPTIGVFLGIASGLATNDVRHAASNAVTGTFIGCFILNLAVSAFAYLTGE